MLNRGSSLGGALGSFWLLISLLGVAIIPAQAQNAPSAGMVKLGIVSFLTGPAAAPFGIPGRNGAEIMIEAMNAGKVPAPFNKVGFGGSNIEAKYIDEAGSAANVVTEFRNLVQRDKVDVRAIVRIIVAELDLTLAASANLQDVRLHSVAVLGHGFLLVVKR